jgi:F0F1-type ATP synthase membrane subunit b/b'
MAPFFVQLSGVFVLLFLACLLKYKLLFHILDEKIRNIQ